MTGADHKGLPSHLGDEEPRIPCVVAAYKADQKDSRMGRSGYAFACYDGRNEGEMTRLTSC
jgi:hypothetical protein